MLALTQDTDGDGVTDVYGYGSRWDFMVYNLTMSNGTTMQAVIQKTFPALRLQSALILFIICIMLTTLQSLGMQRIL